MTIVFVVVFIFYVRHPRECDATLKNAKVVVNDWIKFSVMSHDRNSNNN